MPVPTGHQGQGKLMRKRTWQLAIFPVLIAISACAGIGAPSESVDSAEDALPDEYVGQIVIGNTSGIVVSESFGMADRETETPVDTKTVFDIGSLTKQFTATAILKLASEGKLHLEDDLGSFFENPGKRKEKITVHQLLTHTSGLAEYSGEDYDLRDRAGIDSWLAYTKLEFDPGERFFYSNPGYAVLARIIEITSNVDFETYLWRNLWRPAGLTRIGYTGLPEHSVEAVGYGRGQRFGRPRDQLWLEDGPSWNVRGNGGLLMSAETLFKWVRAVDNNEILPAQWTQKLFTRYVFRSRRRGVWYGYGWDISDRDWGEQVSHTGGNLVFFAYVEWHRDSNCLFTMTSSAYDEVNMNTAIRGIRRYMQNSLPGCTGAN
jgi:CubicO group peptidase (beta-lactamase class C family)